MTRFNDELLSAYLDGEISADERAAVESHLATSESDRRLLDELQSLRGEFQSLPRTAVSANFADRVVRAALAAKADADASVTPVSITTTRQKSRRWPIWATVLATGLIIAAVVFVPDWNFSGPDVVQDPTITTPEEIDPTAVAGANGPSPADLLIAELRQAAPATGEAVVLRLRVPKGTPLGQALDVALAEAGIGQRPAFDVNSGAIQLGAAYRQQLQAKPASDLVPVSDALFVDASLEQIEAALKAIAGERSLGLAAESTLAFTTPPQTKGPEGEAGSENTDQPFAQRLNAGMFRLEKRDIAAAVPAAGPPAAADPQRLVKILILVEQVD